MPTPPRPTVTCPACLHTSDQADDVRLAYCPACHAFHSDLAPWGLDEFGAFMLQRFLDGRGRPSECEPSSRPLLDALRRLGLLDGRDACTEAARVWGRSRRGVSPPVHRLAGPEYSAERIGRRDAPCPAPD